MTITWLYPAFLFLIPILLGLFLLRRRHHARSSIARPKVKHLVASPTGVSSSIEPARLARRGGGWFGFLALSFAFVALARPQWGEIEQQTYERSREVVIALDLSRSMLAPDVPPSRLDRAKLLVDSLINEMQGERIGLVVFAGTSFVQCPLSNDYEVLREMLKEVNPSYLPQQGTDFGKLLQTSYKAFDFSSTSDRFLIVLSDGEDLAGDWKGELKNFADARIHIISLGIGTTAGSVLPETGGGVIKDEKGAVVLSRLDSSVLQQLATETGGRYVEAYRWVDLSKIISETVDQGQRGEYAKKEEILKVERFQIPLTLAIVFAFLSLWRDFPVYPRHSIRKPDQPGQAPIRPLGVLRKKSASSSISSGTALLLLLLLMPLTAQDLPSPTAAAQPQPADKLSGTVKNLSSKNDLVAPDYAQLAEETITYGKARQQAKASIEMGAIDDALFGVDEGEALDGKAADWPKLRKELEDLKKKSSDQQQQKKDQQKQDKQDKDNKDKDQKQDQQKQNSGGSGDQDKDKQKDPSKGDQNSKQDQKDPQNQKDQQDQKDQQSKDQQSKDQKGGQNGKDPQKQDSQGQNPPKDQKDQNSDPKQGQDPKDQDGKQDPRNQPKPQSAQPDEKKDTQPQTKKVGGASAGQKDDKNQEEAQQGESADMIRKLDQIKQKDSPGQIYQLFSPQEPSKETKGKTW